MRVLAAALAVLLLVAICSVAGATLRDHVQIAAPSQMQETVPLFCCFANISHRIPLRLIRSAYRTSNSCPNPAVVLVTRRGKQLCADPKTPWVQKYLEHLELQEY